MPRYLGVDYGLKRIGLAVCDAETSVSMPLATIDNCKSAREQVRAVAEYATRYTADEIVVGLPLNMDDSEGGQAALSRRFGEQVARETGLPVRFHDERLSSRAATELLVAAGVPGRRRKALVDKLAAQAILQSFLELQEANQANQTDEPTEPSSGR